MTRVLISVEIRSQELGTHNTSVEVDVEKFGEAIDLEHPTLDAFFKTFEEQPDGDIMRLGFTLERL